MPTREKGYAICVENRGAAVRQALEQFALCPRNGLNRPECCEMGRSDIGQHTMSRGRNLAEPTHFALLANPHLNDRSLMAPCQSEQGLWNSDVVIVIPRRHKRCKAFCKNSANHLFRGRFPVAAADRHDGDRESPPMSGRQLLKSPQGIIHLHYRNALQHR